MKRLRRVVYFGAVIIGLLYFVACQTINIRENSDDDERLTRNTIETDTDWTLSYLSAGSSHAPRLIYVHGTPGSAKSLQRYLIDPVEGFESISIDRPGFGKTAPREPSFKLEDQSRVIEPLLEERDGQYPILIGHSLGGPIVARVAADYPDRVAAIVILSGSLDPDLEKVHWYQRVGEFLFMPYLIPRALRNANREVIPLDDELRALGPMLAKVQCPVYIVHSTDDSLVPFENVAYMEVTFPEEKIKGIVILEDKDHFLPWNAEGVVRKTIQAAIEATLQAHAISSE